MTETSEQRLARIIDKALDLIAEEAKNKNVVDTHESDLIQELVELQKHPSQNFAKMKRIGEELGWSDEKKANDAILERLKKFDHSKKATEEE